MVLFIVHTKHTQTLISRKEEEGKERERELLCLEETV